MQEEVPEVKDDEERTQFLQRVLLDYLAIRSTTEPALSHARHFYLAQWYQDNTDPGKPADLSKRKKTKSSRKKYGLYCVYHSTRRIGFNSYIIFKVQMMMMMVKVVIPVKKMNLD